jgi:hypothetical protein
VRSLPLLAAVLADCGGGVGDVLAPTPMIRGRLGNDVGLAYSQPQLAGGVVTTADAVRCGALIRKAWTTATAQ